MSYKLVIRCSEPCTSIRAKYTHYFSFRQLMKAPLSKAQRHIAKTCSAHFLFSGALSIFLYTFIQFSCNEKRRYYYVPILSQRGVILIHKVESHPFTAYAINTKLFPLFNISSHNIYKKPINVPKSLPAQFHRVTALLTRTKSFKKL